MVRLNIKKKTRKRSKKRSSRKTLRRRPSSGNSLQNKLLNFIPSEAPAQRPGLEFKDIVGDLFRRGPWYLFTPFALESGDATVDINPSSPSHGQIIGDVSLNPVNDYAINHVTFEIGKSMLRGIAASKENSIVDTIMHVSVLGLSGYQFYNGFRRLGHFLWTNPITGIPIRSLIGNYAPDLAMAIDMEYLDLNSQPEQYTPMGSLFVGISNITRGFEDGIQALGQLYFDVLRMMGKVAESEPKRSLKDILKDLIPNMPREAPAQRPGLEFKDIFADLFRRGPWYLLTPFALESGDATVDINPSSPSHGQIIGDLSLNPINDYAVSHVSFEIGKYVLRGIAAAEKRPKVDLLMHGLVGALSGWQIAYGLKRFGHFLWTNPFTGIPLRSFIGSNAPDLAMAIDMEYLDLSLQPEQYTPISSYFVGISNITRGIEDGIQAVGQLYYDTLRIMGRVAEPDDMY